MSRFWPAALTTLALSLHAGQTFAFECNYSGVSITSGGTITVNCTSPGSYTARLNNTSANSCSYSGSTNSPAIRITGSSGLVEAWCPPSSVTPSTGVTFAIAADTTASVGTPLAFTVTRTTGNGTAGTDTLSIASEPADTASVFFNPASVSFGPAEGTSVARASKVIFTKSGEYTLTATSAGNTVTASGKIKVGSSVTGICQGIPAPAYVAKIDSLAGSTHLLTTPTASERATGAIRFTAPASGSHVFTLGPSDGPLDMAISACPGDFSPANVACRAPAVTAQGVTVTVGNTNCPLSASTPYYINLRAVTPGRDIGFTLTAPAP